MHAEPCSACARLAHAARGASAGGRKVFHDFIWGAGGLDGQAAHKAGTTSPLPGGRGIQIVKKPKYTLQKCRMGKQILHFAFISQMIPYFRAVPSGVTFLRQKVTKSRRAAARNP